MKYHPLTEKIFPTGTLIEIPTQETLHEAVDKVICQWLDDKTIEIDNFAHQYGTVLGAEARSILELTKEQTLEEKFKDYFPSCTLDDKEIKDMAQIAEDHYKENK